MAYSRDLKLRAVAYVEEGHNMNQTAAVFKVHISTVIRWVEQYKKTGDVKNKVRKPVNKKINPEELVAYVQEHPDAYLKEIAQKFGCCPAAVLRRLRKLGITRKKRVLFTRNKTPKK